MNNDIYELGKPLLEDYLYSKGLNPSKPMKCINPNHDDSTPSMSYDKDRLRVKCFGCDYTGDIFDVIQTLENKTEDETRQTVKAMLNMTDTPIKNTQKKSTPQKADNLPNYTDFYKKAYSNINNTNYLTDRGISQEIINKYKIGYVKNWKDPRPDKKAYFDECIILPIDESTYIARNTRSSEFRYSNVGKIKPVNLKYLNDTTNTPIFILEGYIDALSVETLGHRAISLNSTAGKNIFIKYIKNTPINKNNKIILFLDNDDAGEQATNDIVNAFNELGIQNYAIADKIEHNDANDYLRADKDGFKEYLILQEQKDSNLDDEIAEYKQQSNGLELLNQFMLKVDKEYKPPIKTGFKGLDDALDGGLYDGLYFIGAISSLGKTAYTLQLADQIAKNGNDVIFISLEMSKYELIGRSISRNSYLTDTQHACTTREITNPILLKELSHKQQTALNTAYRMYGKYAGNLYIHEGIGNIDVNYIEKQVKEHIRLTGNRPVLVIDYLQIIAPNDVRQADKQATDYNVTALKRLSRNYQIPVVAISSFNRENYDKPISMTAFKESGAIEYSSDVLIGLQFKGMQDAGDKSENKKIVYENKKLVYEQKQKDKRQVELVILKNRNGRPNVKLDYNYFAKYHTFSEILDFDKYFNNNNDEKFYFDEETGENIRII